MKHQSSDEEVQSRSDASSRNVADSEVEVEPIGVPDAADTQQVREKRSSDGAPLSNPPPPPPAKKKRTRTLTTPHQSAVLHALLAQVGLPPIEAALTLNQRTSPVPLSYNCHA